MKNYQLKALKFSFIFLYCYETYRKRTHFCFDLLSSTIIRVKGIWDTFHLKSKMHVNAILLGYIDEGSQLAKDVHTRKSWCVLESAATNEYIKRTILVQVEGASCVPKTVRTTYIIRVKRVCTPSLMKWPGGTLPSPLGCKWMLYI